MYVCLNELAYLYFYYLWICFSRDQIVLACEVLKTFLSVLDPSFILGQYGTAMVRALKHPNVEVKQLALLEVRDTN